MQAMRFSVISSLLLVACTPATAQPTFSGIARNIDGDSLHVGDKEVRLFGIDAPEWGQVCSKNGQPWDCGAAAADQLNKLVTGKPVSCVPVDTDEHGRTVAQCTAGNIDVNRTMVATGYAVAYRHYSTAYVSAEESAKVNKRGLWAGTFETPSQYRHQDQLQVRRSESRKRTRTVQTYNAPAQASGGCNIKGNRGSNGWIYHVPGMPYYERTRAEEMFCSEAQARAAGYRRARVQ